MRNSLRALTFTPQRLHLVDLDAEAAAPPAPANLDASSKTRFSIYPVFSWSPILLAFSISAAAPTPWVPLRGTGGERPTCSSSLASTLAWTALGAATGAFAGWAAHGRGAETGAGIYIGVGAAFGGGLGFAADRLCHDQPARGELRPATPMGGAPAAATGASLK